MFFASAVPSDTGVFLPVGPSVPRPRGSIVAKSEKKLNREPAVLCPCVTQFSSAPLHRKSAGRKSHWKIFSFLVESVQSWPTKKMSSTRKVSLVSSSLIAPNCGGKVLRRPNLRSEPELAIDCQSDSASYLCSSIVSSFDLVLSSIVNSSANGEKSSLCESVPVQGADF